MTDIAVHHTFVDGPDVLTWFDLHTTIAPPAPTANWRCAGRGPPARRAGLAARGKTTEEVSAVLRRPVSLGFVIWIIIGLVVASNKGFLSHLDTVSGVLSAVLAVLVWPLVLLEVHIVI